MMNKKNLIIFGGIGLVLLLGIALCFIFFNSKDDETNSKSQNNPDDKIVAPAINTEELIQEMNSVSVDEVTEDEIIFSSDVDIKENERVAVWIYSEPKFLGYFEVLLENGVRKIVGLKEALDNISIEVGEHNIAITTESGKPIGYIDVHIEDDGKLSPSIEQDKVEDEVENTTTTTKKTTTSKTPKKETTNKEITLTEEINFETTTQKEVNMLKGTTSVIQEGVKGEKQVTYAITYDSNGNEIARYITDQKIIKQPINKIEKVGTSDFNMNTDMLTEVSWGPACTELNEDGYCDEGTLKYEAVKINNTYYVTSITENGSPIFNGLLKISGSEGINLVVNYSGIKYYCYMSAGGGQYELLTEETCNKYGLSCGKW